MDSPIRESGAADVLEAALDTFVAMITEASFGAGRPLLDVNDSEVMLVEAVLKGFPQNAAMIRLKMNILV